MAQHQEKGKHWFLLFTTNFLGVFNDNFLKHCIVFISLTWAMPGWISQAQLISIVAAALVVPYLIFSPLAGKWSIAHSKQKIWRLFKLLEIPIMLLAAAAFLFESIYVAIFSVLLMGIQSSMYSPAKYGLIRDVGGQEGVSFGSGVFETMSFLGILLGSVLAPWISDHYNVWLVVSIFLGVAFLGYFTSMRMKIKEIPVESDASTSANPIRFLLDSIKEASQYKYLNSAVLGSSVFWMIGGMIQMNVVIHSTKTLGLSNTISGIVLCCAAVGIALGCTIAGVLAKNKVRPGMIPLGLFGMIFALTCLVWIPMSPFWTGFSIFLLAFMGGFFEVPCMALIQHANLGRKLGAMIGYLNFVNFVFILIGTGLFSLTTILTNDSSHAVFVVIMVCCLLTGAYFYLRHPEFFKWKKSRVINL